MPKFSGMVESSGSSRNYRRYNRLSGVSARWNVMYSKSSSMLLVMGTSFSVLAREINLWMYHTHMSGQSVVATERLLLYT